MNRKPVWVLISILAFTACKEKEKSSAEPPPLPASTAAVQPPAAPAAPAVPAATTAAAAAAAAAAPTAAAPVAAGDIPTSEDYERQAIDEINPQNMTAEVDKLEKDIGP
jgi:hypothetical protein